MQIPAFTPPNVTIVASLTAYYGASSLLVDERKGYQPQEVSTL